LEQDARSNLQAWKALMMVAAGMAVGVGWRISTLSATSQKPLFAIEGSGAAPLAMQSANPVPAVTASQPTPSAEPLAVHVVGRVKAPGVYRLPAGARVLDAIAKAGGELPNSDTQMLNLAAKLEDGQQIRVPAKGEAPPAAAVTVRSTHTSGGAARTGGGKLKTPGQGTVNINTAGADELTKLDGVGPSTAARIIEYRQANGPFTSPEQLMEVKGIGEKKFARMQPFVRIR
jgi:competence protein ComEA